MTDEFLYNGETEVLLKLFSEQSDSRSQIPLVVEGKRFNVSFVVDWMYRYGLTTDRAAEVLGISEEGLIKAIGEFVEEVKAKIDANIKDNGIVAIPIMRELVMQEIKEELTVDERRKTSVNKTSESD